MTGKKQEFQDYLTKLIRPDRDNEKINPYAILGRFERAGIDAIDRQEVENIKKCLKNYADLQDLMMNMWNETYNTIVREETEQTYDCLMNTIMGFGR